MFITQTNPDSDSNFSDEKVTKDINGFGLDTEKWFGTHLSPIYSTLIGSQMQCSV